MLSDDEATFDQPLKRPGLPGPAPSYTYAKFSLPRGRIVSDGSTQLPKNEVHRFEFEEPSLPVLAHIEPDPAKHDKLDITTTSEATPSTSQPAATFPQSRTRPQLRLDTTTASSKTSSPSLNTHPFTATSLTPEEHLATGIACHEAGQLPKSTYHLRLAARAGLPAAMLLYALACRHGWGTRANQAEGVAWLRKAVEAAGGELAACSTSPAVATTNAGPTNPTDTASPCPTSVPPAPNVPTSLSQLLAHKAHKTQLALAIYELGQCSMNGWGIETDKVAGLRAFEIAGAMGDADAVAEAAFSYAKGVGCKRDMKKAAELYRRAEGMGVVGVGTSWIWKEKYMGGEEKESRKPIGKSLFGKKKATEATAA